MICSELEASQKRCTVDPTNYSCMGKACMAWKITTESKDQQFDAPPPEGDGWKAVSSSGYGGGITHRKVYQREAGYCGWMDRP